jgi:hypothetical protein
MKNPLLLVAVLLPFLLGLSGCSTKEKYAANQAATKSWLDAKAGTPGIRLNGMWVAFEDGWGGPGRFEQQGNRIIGALGNYTVQGVVNGSTVYLAFISDGWTYYTGVLKMRDGILGGFYSSSVPFSSEDQGSLNLRRLAN